MAWSREVGGGVGGAGASALSGTTTREKIGLTVRATGASNGTAAGETVGAWQADARQQCDLGGAR